MPDMMETMTEQIKGGLINGSALYLTNKLVETSDQAAFNMIGTGLPDMVRTPLVGLALSTLAVSLSQNWIVEKAAEYTMANAVASALTVAGGAQGVDSGPLDQQIDSLFLPIANIGLPAGSTPFTQATFWGLPTASTKGYVTMAGRRTGNVASRFAAPTRGYVKAGNLPGAFRGYVKAATVNDGRYTPQSTGNMRTTRLRGVTSELR